jgi:hypothetical protein
LLHLPIGIYYIKYVTDHDLVSAADYLFATLALIAAMIVIVLVPVQFFKDRNSPYPFSREELARFHMVEKYIARGVIGEAKGGTR